MPSRIDKIPAPSKDRHTGSTNITLRIKNELLGKLDDKAEERNHQSRSGLLLQMIETCLNDPDILPQVAIPQASGNTTPIICPPITIKTTRYMAIGEPRFFIQTVSGNTTPCLEKLDIDRFVSSDECSICGFTKCPVKSGDVKIYSLASSVKVEDRGSTPVAGTASNTELPQPPLGPLSPPREERERERERERETDNISRSDVDDRQLLDSNDDEKVAIPLAINSIIHATNEENRAIINNTKECPYGLKMDKHCIPGECIVLGKGCPIKNNQGIT